MSTTRFTDAVEALLAAYHAVLDPDGIPVYDGRQLTAASDPDFVIVGHDASAGPGGDLQATALAGNYLQAWSDFGEREERGSINCLIMSQTGDTGDMAGRRARVTAMLAAAEDAAAGAGAAHLTFDGTADGRFIYRRNLAGIAVMCAYRVAYSAPWG